MPPCIALGVLILLFLTGVSLARIVYPEGGKSANAALLADTCESVFTDDPGHERKQADPPALHDVAAP